MDIVTVLGILGAFLILIGFTMNQLGIWKTTSFSYDCINLAGGLVLVVYAFLISSLPFIILNTVWTLVALRDVILFFLRKKS